MSIASRIQEIETHIGDVYDTINYSYDTTGVNKNIINIPKYLKKGYIDIINNGIDTLYNNFPKVSEIGSNLSLTPTYEAPMKLNEIQGNTLQENTPTPDTPVEIQSVTGLQNVEVCGKNLFDITTYPMEQGNFSYINNSESSNVRIIRSPFIPILPNTTYTISLNENIGELGILYKQKGNSTLIIGFASNINDNKYYTFTTPENAYYMRFRFGNAKFPKTYTNNYDIQLEKGSVATEYEPYKGNTYEVNLGKNLLDISTLQNGYVTSSGTINTSHPLGEMYSELIKVQPNTTYTFKIFETGSAYDNWIGIGEYTANNLSSFIQRITMTTKTQNYFTFTTNSIAKYIIVSARNLAQATKIQLEKGTQSTSFSPYFTPIELNKIGDYQDRIYKDNGKWYVEKQIGKVNLEDYEYNKYGASAGYSRNTTTQIPNIKYVSVNTELGKGLCEKYQIHTGSGMSGNDAENHFAIDVSMFQVSIPNNDTPSGLFYYALATPEYTEITNEELIEDLETLYTAKSQEGTTNISITSEDLEMILNVSALKIE